MAAFLMVFLTAMVIAYALVAVATVKVWSAVTYGEGRHEDRPERIVSEAAGGTRKRRCPEPARRPPCAAGRDACAVAVSDHGRKRRAPPGRSKTVRGKSVFSPLIRPVTPVILEEGPRTA
jgi:hypothetical protein